MNFKLRNTFIFVLFFAFTFSVTNNLFAEKKPVDLVAKEIKYTFYKDNPWAFVERKLLDKPDEKLIKEMQNFKCLGICGLTFVASMVAGALITENLDLQIHETIILFAFLGSFGFSLSAIFCHEYFKNKIFRETLCSFMYKYNPDLNNSDNLNNKKYLPEELKNTFDSLHGAYEKYEGLFLDRGGLKVINMILEKIKYERKPAKYILSGLFRDN